MKKGLLIIFSGPSGCGKGTVLKEILPDDSFYLSVSATTRPPRPTDIDGVDYRFLSKDDFQQRIDSHAMLEYAEFCGNLYGTPADMVDQMRAEGKNVILEIEVEGALQVMKKCPDAISIFLLPPSLSELERRLRNRGTESEEVIRKRIQRAEEEIKLAYHYRYLIVNQTVDTAVEDFRAIIRAESRTYHLNQEIIGEILSC